MLFHCFTFTPKTGVSFYRKINLVQQIKNDRTFHAGNVALGVISPTTDMKKSGIELVPQPPYSPLVAID